MKKFILILFSIFFSVSYLNAQFVGGGNDGYSSSNNVLTPLSIMNIYTGGTNDGYSSSNNVLNPLNIMNIYTGGANDGYSSSNNILNPLNIINIFEGGIRSGYSSKGNDEYGQYYNIEIELSSGWNTISANFLPDAPNMENIFTEMEELIIVKNAAGQIFNPAQNINQIGDWNIAHGYMVYVTAPATLQITGTAVNPTETEINLVSGWNLVSYLRNSPLAINTALEGISSSIILVKNNQGQLYYPSMGLNTIGNMQQGQGYWIYMSAPEVLVYPGN